MCRRRCWPRERGGLRSRGVRRGPAVPSRAACVQPASLASVGDGCCECWETRQRSRCVANAVACACAIVEGWWAPRSGSGVLGVLCAAWVGSEVAAAVMLAGLRSFVPGVSLFDFGVRWHRRCCAWSLLAIVTTISFHGRVQGLGYLPSCLWILVTHPQNGILFGQSCLGPHGYGTQLSHLHWHLYLHLPALQPHEIHLCNSKRAASVSTASFPKTPDAVGPCCRGMHMYGSVPCSCSFTFRP